MDKELQKKIKDLEKRIEKLERPGTNLGAVREDSRPAHHPGEAGEWKRCRVPDRR
jgi:hypothetical protein